MTLRLPLLAVALALAAGLVRFAVAKPPIEVRFARTAGDAPGRRDLALFTEGPIVRVSSALWAARHHPGYLVDGFADPPPLAKWVSAFGDAAPWAEVQLDRPREVDEVALELGAAREPLPAERDYLIECFAGSSRVAFLRIEGNLLGRPRHPLRCARTDRVRVTFAPSDVVRVYELEVWGR